MARAVTPDRDAARRSMQRLLDLSFDHVCPGHRAPGRVDLADRARFARKLAVGDWPLLG